MLGSVAGVGVEPVEDGGEIFPTKISISTLATFDCALFLASTKVKESESLRDPSVGRFWKGI